MQYTLSRSERDQVEDALNIFPEVTWDRFTGDDSDLIVYGWIDRPDDEYKDFMVLVFDLIDMSYWFTTSSAVYSQTFHDRINPNPAAHTDCKRVEQVWPHVKAVQLSNNKST